MLIDLNEEELVFIRRFLDRAVLFCEMGLVRHNAISDFEKDLSKLTILKSKFGK